MSDLKEMRAGRRNSPSAFTEFTLSTRTAGTHLFCFFEGKDNDYYIPRVTSVTEDYYPIKCGNKDAVLRVNELIAGKTEYNKYKVAFFVDRDFNTPIGARPRPVFETPCYSIENFYVSTTAFQHIVNNSFHIPRTQPDFQKITHLYALRQQEFHQATLLFNAWYACLIGKKETEGMQTGASLNDTLPKGFVTIELDGIRVNYDMEKIKSTFPNAPEVDASVLQAKIKAFQASVMHQVFRGKYEMEFLIKFIRVLLTDAKSTTRQVASKKIQFAFGDASSIKHEQALNIFSAYADTPPALMDYLRLVAS